MPDALPRIPSAARPRMPCCTWGGAAGAPSRSAARGL